MKARQLCMKWFDSYFQVKVAIFIKLYLGGISSNISSFSFSISGDGHPSDRCSIFESRFDNWMEAEIEWRRRHHFCCHSTWQKGQWRRIRNRFWRYEISSFFPSLLNFQIEFAGTVDVVDGQQLCPHHYIESIRDGGPAAKTGLLQAGDELLQVKKHPFQNSEQLTCEAIRSQLE